MYYAHELYHHGIKGQKWGVRRYRNEDGSLTPLGKKHYGKMSGEKLYKTLKKEVQSKRADVAGSSNRWLAGEPIGEHSRQLEDKNNKLREQYKNTDEYKKWDKEVSKLSKKMMSDAYYNDPEGYDEKWKSLVKRRPEPNFNDTRNYAIRYGKNGREYMNDYINKGGKDRSMAYLKDLGYSEDVGKEFVKRMAKANRTLGAI